MQALGLDAFVASDLPSVRYLTGFTGSNALVILTPKRICVATDRRYKEQIKKEVRGAALAVAERTLLEAIRKYRWIPAGARVGLEAQSVSVAEWKRFKAEFPGRRFIPTLDLIESLRAVKEPAEISAIRQAVRITDMVFGQVLGYIKPGVRELDIAAEISYWHRRFGAEADAFEPIVAGGARGALPHAHATVNRIRRGQLVTIDLGCRFAGYHSDMTRTVAVGRVGRDLKTMYQVVLEAQLRAIEAATAGTRARAVDAEARSVIAKAGWGKYFSHSLGHGVGLRVHERPRVSALSEDTLQAGNVITIEPGLYVPSVGGVRIEDVVSIESSGPRVLSTSAKEMIVL